MKARMTRMLLLLSLALVGGTPSAQAFYNPTVGKWLNRDPLEEAGGNNLYGFVYNNPANGTDTDGRYPTTSFFIWPKERFQQPSPPSPKDGGISVPGGDNSENNLFDRIARDGADEWTRANTAQEMFAFMHRLTKNNCCIDNLTFAGHGWGPGRDNTVHRGPGIPGATAGSDGLYENGVGHDRGGANLSDLGTQISSGKIRFCKPCLIQIHSCRISPTFIQSLASLTKCKVVAAASSCRPYGPNPTWWESVPGVWKERTDQGGGYTGFWESDGGNPVREIGPVYEPR